MVEPRFPYLAVLCMVLILIGCIVAWHYQGESIASILLVMVAAAAAAAATNAVIQWKMLQWLLRVEREQRRRMGR